jgi:hypothetical protein
MDEKIVSDDRAAWRRFRFGKKPADPSSGEPAKTRAPSICGGLDCGLVRLSALRVALQAQRPQAVHVFYRRLVPGMLLVEGILDLRLPALVFVKYRFGDFALFCAHKSCFSGEHADNA